MQDIKSLNQIMLTEESEQVMSIKARRLYFERPPDFKVYWKLIMGIMLLALVILINTCFVAILSYFSLTTPDFTPVFNLLLLICSLPADIALIRISMYYMRSRPNDTQYENWLQSCLSSLKEYGLDKLDADLEEVTDFLWPVWGPVWFGSPEADYYRSLNCPVSIKRGKDGQLRASANKFTFFYPTHHYIAAFSCYINALQPLRLEVVQIYFYDDIVGVETTTFSFQLENCTYDMQQFELCVSSGQSVEAITYGPDVAFENMVCSLRMLLYNKKYGSNAGTKDLTDI